MHPVLCLHDRTAAPFGRYALEILHAEGVTGAVERDASSGVAVAAEELLGHHAIVVTPTGAATGAEAAALAALRAGAGVVFLRPSLGTARALGLISNGRRVAPEMYLAPERAHPLWCPALGDFLQVHGAADLYDRPEARDNVLAWVAGPDWAMPHPAIVTGTLGAGRFALFAYDLATSTVLFHQGRPELASTGPTPDADGDGTFAPNDLFQGHLDVRLRHVPQADLQQRLLLRVLEWVAEPAGPLVRLWPFPNAAPAVALINGDSDSMTRPQMEAYVDLVESYGGGYTVYLMEQHLPLLPAEMEADYRRRGHSAGPHVWLELQPSPEAMAVRISEEVALFERAYGHPPRTTRHHCVVWPGWVDTARALADAGIGLETNYRAAERYQSGYLTGSGLPMRFIGQQGELIDCFQQETLLCDDYLLIDKSFLRPLDEAEAIALSHRLIDEAIERYHTVFHAYFHPVYSTGLVVRTGQFIRTDGWLEAVLAHSRRRGIPLPNTDAWCEFNDRRRGTVLATSNWDDVSGTLSVQINSVAGLPGATLLFPAAHAGRRLRRAALGADDLSPETREVWGREYLLAVADLLPGSTLLTARYE
jgi:hypothetical protein